MTALSVRGRRAVALLSAQAVAFGILIALLAIAANSLFLAQYGSKWLPVTYLFIAVVGIGVSGAIASSARSGRLVRIATVVLGSSCVLLVASWCIAAFADGAWVSGPLLVLFPILIQLGFVFIGGQAGRVLDIAEMKAKFPRIVAGFPVGAVIGGVAAEPILGAFHRTEHLLLAAAIAQASFLALLVVTGRRCEVDAPSAAQPAGVPEAEATAPTQDAPPTMRRLLGSRFVLLIVGYQVGSAVGSQLVDFLVYDRAAARYHDGEDLAQFVARYTALMNIVSIAFLALLAGALLRRHGLKLGIAANPAVVAVFGAVMLVATVVGGGGSFALLVAVSAARIADVALTDGTTRTSINTTFQVLPVQQRLAVQTSVEGVGVPIAIGLSGALILLLYALPGSVGSMVVITAIVCVVWTWVGFLLYREYRTALVGAVRRRSLLHDAAAADDLAFEFDLDGIAAGDTENAYRQLATDPFAIADVLAALDDPATRTAAADALDRLGDAAAPEVAAVLARAGHPAPPAALRAVRRLRVESVEQVAPLLATHIAHPDRDLGLVVLDRLVADGPGPASLLPVLDDVLLDDARHATRIATALQTLSSADRDVAPLTRALAEEFDLVRRRVAAGRLVRHGRDLLGPVLLALETPEARHDVAVEALLVNLDRHECTLALPLLQAATDMAGHLAAIATLAPSPWPLPDDTIGVLTEIATDPQQQWRSAWLRECAEYAAS